MSKNTFLTPLFAAKNNLWHPEHKTPVPTESKSADKTHPTRLTLRINNRQPDPWKRGCHKDRSSHILLKLIADQNYCSSSCNVKMQVNARDSQTSDWCTFSWGVHEVSLLLYPSCLSFQHLAHTFWVCTAEFLTILRRGESIRKPSIQSLISIALVKVKGTQITKFERR